MPPASRGLVLSYSRVAFTGICRRCYASSARPSSPYPAARQLRLVQAPKSHQHGESQTKKEEAADRASRIKQQFVTRFMRNNKYLGSSLFAFVVTFFVSSWALIHFPLEPRRVTGPSMKPTINPECDSENDTHYSPTWVLVRKSNLGVGQELAKKGRRSHKEVVQYYYDRGDLVVYRTPHDPEKVAVKRIVARAGDTVVPLEGYASGQEPIVVPYNHLWVEGDANDRKKSMDSNYFGPITSGLIKGKVVAMWSPWWNILGIRQVNSDGYDWRATKQARVVENAVEREAADPEHVDKYLAFEAGRAEKNMQFLRTRPDAIRQKFATDEQYELQTWLMWQNGMKAARAHPDPETRVRAYEMVQELQKVLGREALRAAKPGWKKGFRRLTGDQVSQVKDIPADNEQQYASLGSSFQQ